MILFSFLFFFSVPASANESINEQVVVQMGQVSKYVEQIIKSPARRGGIGEQVKDIAEAQNQAQKKIQG